MLEEDRQILMMGLLKMNQHKAANYSMYIHHHHLLLLLLPAEITQHKYHYSYHVWYSVNYTACYTSLTDRWTGGQLVAQIQSGIHNVAEN